MFGLLSQYIASNRRFCYRRPPRNFSMMINSNCIARLVKKFQNLSKDMCSSSHWPKNLKDVVNYHLNKFHSVYNFLHFFARRGRPLWSCEDITPRTLNTLSAVQVEYFLKLIIRYFQELSPKAFVEQRWSQVALQVALSCSSRHYAGRSFQVHCIFMM